MRAFISRLITGSIIVLIGLQGVAAAPEPLEIGAIKIRGKPDPHAAAHEAALQTLMGKANQQVQLMKAVVDAASSAASSPAKTQALAAIHTVFGMHADVGKIKERVYLLASPGKVTIRSTAAPLPKGTIAEAVQSVPRGIDISTEFWDRTHSDDTRIGVLIHEATHLLFGTFDLWTPVPTGPGDKSGKKFKLAPTKQSENKLIKLNGYWGQKFEEVRESLGPDFVDNADAWFVFGAFLAHGKLPAVPVKGA